MKIGDFLTRSALPEINDDTLVFDFDGLEISARSPRRTSSGHAAAA
jgi:hypothetical protein